MKEIQIGDGRYAIIVEDKDGILKDEDLHMLSDTLRKWWEGDAKFIILAEWGNIKVKFQRMEEE